MNYDKVKCEKCTNYSSCLKATGWLVSPTRCASFKKKGGTEWTSKQEQKA